MESVKKLVEDNMNLVHFLVQNRFRISPKDQEYYDYVQEGMIGLIQAASRFDESKGFKFSTYAGSMVLGNIMRYKRDYTQIKTSRESKNLRKYLQEIDELGVEEFIEKSGIDRGKVYEMLNTTCVSMETILVDGEDLKLEDTISDDTRVEDEIISKLQWERLFEVVNIVVDKEKERIKNIYYDYFYGSLYGEKPSENGLADKYNCSQAQVSRIINRMNKKIRDFYELNKEEF